MSFGEFDYKMEGISEDRYKYLHRDIKNINNHMIILEGLNFDHI